MGGRIVVSGMIMGPMPPVEVQWIGNSGIVMPTFRPNRPSKLPRHKMPLLSLPVMKAPVLTVPELATPVVELEAAYYAQRQRPAAG